MKKHRYFDLSLISKFFPSGFHKVVCTDTNITNLQIDKERIKLFDFIFYEPKIEESIWIQIRCSEKKEDHDRILRLLSILTNKPINRVLNDFSYKDLIQKECLIHIERNLAGIPEIDGFIAST